MKEQNFYTVYSNKYFEVEASKKLYDDSNPYYRISTNDSIICLLMNKQDEVILVQQYRPNLNYETLEFPAGSVEKNETPEQSAKRELEEETGFICSLKFIGVSRLLMSRYTNREFLFCGLAIKPSKNQDINIKTMSLSRNDFCKLITDGKFEHLAALGLVQLLNNKFGINFFRVKNFVNKIWDSNED